MCGSAEGRCTPMMALPSLNRHDHLQVVPRRGFGLVSSVLLLRHRAGLHPSILRRLSLSESCSSATLQRWQSSSFDSGAAGPSSAAAASPKGASSTASGSVRAGSFRSVLVRHGLLLSLSYALSVIPVCRTLGRHPRRLSPDLSEGRAAPSRGRAPRRGRRRAPWPPPARSSVEVAPARSRTPRRGRSRVRCSASHSVTYQRPAVRIGAEELHPARRTASGSSAFVIGVRRGGMVLGELPGHQPVSAQPAVVVLPDSRGHGVSVLLSPCVLNGSLVVRSLGLRSRCSRSLGCESFPTRFVPPPPA